MMRGRKWLAVVGLALLVGLGVGCSHSHSQAPKVTGSPEALAVVEKLKGLNDPPPVIFGTLVWEATQPRGARWAELCGLGASKEAIASAKTGPAEYSEVYRYERMPEGQGFRGSETWKADGKDYSPPATEFHHDWMSEGRRACGFMPLPTSFNQVSVRRETYNGEMCVVLRDDFVPLYREYYLSEKDGWIPKRIIQRQKPEERVPLTLPTTDRTCGVESETGRWPFQTRRTTYITVPAAAFKELDLNWRVMDSDTTVTNWVKRPDGKWFITESTTTYPLFRRTEHFRVENLSFEAVPDSRAGQ